MDQVDLNHLCNLACDIKNEHWAICRKISERSKFFSIV